MVTQTDHQDIHQVKDRIVNGSLIIGSLLGFTVLSINMESFSESTFKIGYLLDFLILLMCGFLYLARKRLPLAYRVGGAVLAILIICMADLYRDGVFSDNKILLIFIPFLLQLILPVWKSILLYLLSMTGYVYFGIRYVEGSLSPTLAYELYANSPVTWITSFILLSLVAAVVVILVNTFIAAFRRQNTELQVQNAELEEYRERLEEKVLEKTSDLEQANEELKATLNNLKETQGQLVQSEKMASLGILTAGVGHELNNPLNFITGGTQGISRFLRESGNLEKEQTLGFYLESIETGLEQAGKIVQGLAQYSRQTEELTEACDIHEILNNNLRMLNKQWEGRITIERNFAKEALIIQGNLGKLHQAFLNILVNANQAIEGKGKISIHTKKTDGSVFVEIRDTGSGIKTEDLNKVCDPFFTTKDPGEGTGLGLSITSNIIHEHKGSLQIDSAPGEGTLVKVRMGKILP